MEHFPPPAGQNPFVGRDVPVTSEILPTKMLSDLATDYAASVDRLVTTALDQEDPYRGSNSDALLAVVAARDVHRIAVSIRDNGKIPDFLSDSIRSRTERFEADHPHLKTARDIIQHADAYINSDGRIKRHWFDITRIFSDGQFHLRISSDLEIDMMKLSVDVKELANHVDMIVDAWLGIELRFKKAENFARILMDRGFSAEIIIREGFLDVINLKMEPSSEKASVTVSIRT